MKPDIPHPGKTKKKSGLHRILIWPDIQLSGQPDIRPDILQMTPDIRPDTGYKKTGYLVQP